MHQKEEVVEAAQLSWDTPSAIMKRWHQWCVQDLQHF